MRLNKTCDLEVLGFGGGSVEVFHVAFGESVEVFQVEGQLLLIELDVLVRVLLQISRLGLRRSCSTICLVLECWTRRVVLECWTRRVVLEDQMCGSVGLDQMSGLVIKNF